MPFKLSKYFISKKVMKLIIVNLSILNQNNDLVWAEQVSVKSDGGYSTLAIADGEGWENSGTYNIKVEDGTEIKSIKFTFTS